MTTLKYIICITLLALAGCGSEPPPAPPSLGGSSNSADQVDQGLSHTMFFEIAGKGLGLASASVDTIKLDVTCDDVDMPGLADVQFQLFDGSTNCLVKLKSFALDNGRLYTPRNGGDYTAYKAGEIAIFDSGDQTLYVVIDQQLPALINAPAEAKYQFSELNNFDDLDAQKKVEHGILTTLMGDFAVAIEVQPPVFDDTSIAIVGTCMGAPITGTTIADGACLGDSFASMQLALDDYPATTDRVVLETLSNNAPTLVDLGAELIPAEAGVTNGGFKVTLPFDGVSPVDQILILHMLNSQSYLFGKIVF